MRHKNYMWEPTKASDHEMLPRLPQILCNTDNLLRSIISTSVIEFTLVFQKHKIGCI